MNDLQRAELVVIARLLNLASDTFVRNMDNKLPVDFFQGLSQPEKYRLRNRYGMNGVFYDYYLMRRLSVRCIESVD